MTYEGACGDGTQASEDIRHGILTLYLGSSGTERAINSLVEALGNKEIVRRAFVYTLPKRSCLDAACQAHELKPRGNGPLLPLSCQSNNTSHDSRSTT